MKLRFGLMFLALLMVGVVAIGASAAAGVALQPTLQEVTLYTQNIAEVAATANYAGPGSVAFRLPLSVEGDTVVIEEGGRPLSYNLALVFTAVKGKPGRKTPTGYLAKVTGLPAGEHAFSLRYRVHGLGWNPNYSLVLEKPEEGILRSAVTIINNALPLTKATLKLISGRVQTGPYVPSPEDYEEWADMARVMGGSPNIPSPSLPGNIHQIQVLKNITIAKDSTYQLPVQETKLGVEERFVWDGTKIEYTDPAYRERAVGTYTLHNQTGEPLAEGKVKVYKQNILVGEGFLGWTTQGDTGTLVMAGVKDLTVKRAEKTEQLPKTWETQNTVTLKVTNNGKYPARVQVIDQISQRETSARYYNQEQPVYTFSEAPEKTSEDAYSWTVTLPAGAEHTISYGYAQPMDLTTVNLLRFECNDSPKERSYLYEERNTKARQDDRNIDSYRAIEGEGYAIYRLEFPAGVSRADLRVEVSSNILVSLAADEQGKPGAFQAAVEVEPQGETRYYDDEDSYKQEKYYLDLSPYLAKQKIVYVKFENKVQTAKRKAHVFGLTAYRLPEGFSSRGRDYMAEVTRKSAENARKQRMTLLHFPADNSAQERGFIYEDHGSAMFEQDAFRFMDADHSIIYRLEVPYGLSNAELILDIANNFVVSLAADRDGKPAEFKVVSRSAELFGKDLHDQSNRDRYHFDLSSFLADNPKRTVYVKLEDGSKTDGWGPSLWEIQLDSLPEKAANGPRRGKLLFSDNFTRPDLKDWQTVRPEAKPYWQVRDGVLVTLLGEGADSLFTNLSFPHDQIITARWQATNAKDYSICMVFSHAKSREAFYQATLWERPETQYAGGFYLDGGATSVTSIPLNLDGSFYHEMTVEVVGKRVRVWMDGNIFFEWDDTLGKLAEGPIGFRGHNFRVDSVEVYEVPPQQ